MVLITLDETPMDENKMTKTRKNELDCLEKRIKAKEHFCVLMILKKLKLQNWENREERSGKSVNGSE